MMVINPSFTRWLPGGPMVAEAGRHLPRAAGDGVGADVAAGRTASQCLDAPGAFLGRGAGVSLGFMCSLDGKR